MPLDDSNLPVLDEHTYVKETALALWEGLPRVILAGVLFSLVALPAVVLFWLGFTIPALVLGALTVGPGWAAATAMVARAVLREETCSVGDFFRAFGHFFGRGALLGGLLAAAAGSLPLLARPPVPGVVWVGLAADGAGLLFLSILYVYAYPLLILYDAGLRVAMRNSFVLAARYFSNTLGLLGMALLLGLLAYKVSLMLLVILPAAWNVFVINNCRMVLRREFGEAGNPSNPDVE